MKIWRNLLILLVLVAGGAWYANHAGWVSLPFLGAQQPQTAAGGGRFGGGGAGGSQRNPPVPVLVAAARYEDVPVTSDAVGTVLALNTVTVHTQVDGRLAEVDFTEGQDVKKGDIIARIDPVTYQATYNQAVAKLAQDQALLTDAKLDLDRYKQLAQQNYGSKQQADTQTATVAQLTAQLQSDQAAIDSAKATLDYTTIRSPIDGRTGIRAVDAGNIVHAADTNGIVVITQVQPISMIFNLPQQQLGAINGAMAKGPVKVEALDADNTTVVDTGTLLVVDNQVDQTTGTMKIKATFDNAKLQLWPGQFVNVRVFIDTLKHAVVVPSAAVQRGPNGGYVYTLGDDNHVKLTLVATGRQDEKQAVITQGLTPPAQVVTTGFAQLTDGALVQPAVATEPGAASADAAGAEPAAASPADIPADANQRGRGRGRRSGGAGPPGAGAAAAPAAAGSVPAATPAPAVTQ